MLSSRRVACCLGEVVGRGKRVQFCQIQRFIDINIPQPGEEGLVEQQGLELASGGMQMSEQIFSSETFIERLRTQVSHHPVDLIHQPDTTKLTGIVENQLDIALQLEDQAGRESRGVHYRVSPAGHRSCAGGRAANRG